MKMKKIIALTLGTLLTCSCLLAGCNKAPENQESETKETKEDSGTEETAEKETPASGDTVVLKLAPHTALDRDYVVAIKHQAPLIYQRTDRRVKIED